MIGEEDTSYSHHREPRKKGALYVAQSEGNESGLRQKAMWGVTAH